MYTLNMNNYPSNEETLIHSLVDDIYQAESKITEINQNQLEYNENNQQQIEIKKLEEEKEKLKKNLTEISSSLLSYLSNNNSLIKEKQNLINDLNNQINQLKEKLSKFNPVTFQSLTLSKYILSNNSIEFLTKEQINQIIIDSKKSQTHGNEFQKFQLEIDNYEINKNNIISNIEELKQKEGEVKELLKMAKEEKLVVKDEIINLISQKESLDEILKFKKLNMNLFYDNKSINVENNNQIELLPYELINLDINKTSNKLIDDIIEIIEINNNKQNNNLNNINGNNSLEMENNNIHISINNNYLNNIIKNELTNFHKLLKIKKNNTKDKVKEFINSLCKSIISCFVSNISISNSNSQQFSYNNINDYLSYFLKAIIYEGIIENKLNFINKEYKFVKKERNKILENLFLNITKLKNKLDDIDNKLTELNSQIKLFEKQNDIDVKNLQPNLTQNELIYIEISTNGNNLLNQKNEILKEISNIENDNKKAKEESNEKEKETNKNMEKIDEEINKLKEEIESEKLKSNQEIINLRKLIADKFNIIKTQLQIYKSKYGSNLSIYNRLVDSINSTIKSTYYQSPFSYDRKNYESKSMIQDNNSFYSPRIRTFNQIYPNYPNSFINENLINLRSNNDINDSNFNFMNNPNLSINEFQKIPFSNYNTYNNSLRLKNKVPLSKSSHNIFINNTNNENSIMDKSHNETKYSINRINLSIDRTIPNLKSTREKQNEEINLNNSVLNNSENNTINVLNNNLNRTNQGNTINVSNNNINQGNTIDFSSNNLNQGNTINLSNNNINQGNTIDVSSNNLNQGNTIDVSSNNLNQTKQGNTINLSSNNLNQGNTINVSSNNLNQTNTINVSNNNLNQTNENTNTNTIIVSKEPININKNINKIPNKTINLKNTHHNKTNSAYNPTTNYNLNNDNKIWLEEREKLSKVIQNLKEKISKTEKISNVNNSLMNKLSPLTQITFCYYRAINGPYHKFNPLSNINSNSLIVQPYNFIKSTISLNKRLDIIKIVPSTQLNYIDIKIENIENTIVNSMIKIIIEIHRNYRRYKSNFKNGNLDDFIEKENSKYNKLSKKDISKCALNKSFNFSLLMKNNQRIEILLCSYEDFKMWVNGVAFIIKNKKEILKNIKNKDELIEK